jgi:adenylate cyclase
MLGADAASRRLAAIVVAEAGGCSRLLEADEEETLARLKSLRRDRIGPKIAPHEGRTVKSTRDGTLVEFANAIKGAPIAAS